MFGVVPRTLWAAKAAPDRENRITLALNCYLVRTPGATSSSTRGSGPDVGRRYIDFYSFDRRPGLFAALAAIGLGPEDIDIVVNSHLHFDHCGGNTTETGRRDLGARLSPGPLRRPAGRVGAALHPVERDRPSYMPARLKPLADTGRLVLLEGDGPIAPGVEAVLVAGHTAFHQGVKVASGGRTFFYPADAVPTAAHVDLDYIMSFDLYPADTFEAKKALLARAEAEGLDPRLQPRSRDPFGSLEARREAPRRRPRDRGQKRLTFPAACLYDNASNFRGGCS